MSKLDTTIKRLLESENKGCSCGCNTCHLSILSINIDRQYDAPISEGIRKTIESKKSLIENIYTPGTKAHYNLIIEGRTLWEKKILNVDQKTLTLFERTDLGKKGYHKKEMVPLDYVFPGNNKQYKVFTRNKKSGKIQEIKAPITQIKQKLLS